MSTTLVLGHVLSQGNAWIPLLTVGGIAVLVLFVMVVSGRMTIAEPGDLLLPAASVVLVAGLAGSLASADWLLDQGPWIVPAALVIIVALVVSSVDQRVTLGPTSLRANSVVALVAAIAAAASFVPLDDAWFGEEDTVFSVEPDDAVATLTLVSPPDAQGRLTVEVSVEGGTIGDNIPRTTRPSDPEREMAVKFLINGQPRVPAIPAACAADPDCTSAQFELLSATDEPLTSVVVEFLTADQVAFTSPIDAALTAEQLSAS